jgi:hypothetical protein
MLRGLSILLYCMPAWLHAPAAAWDSMGCGGQTAAWVCACPAHTGCAGCVGHGMEWVAGLPRHHTCSPVLGVVEGWQQQLAVCIAAARV